MDIADERGRCKGRVRAFIWLTCAVLTLGGCAAKKRMPPDEKEGNCDETEEENFVQVDPAEGRCGDSIAADHVFACVEFYAGGCDAEWDFIGRECASIVEGCDGSDLRDQTCGSLGYATGELRCDQCVLDATRCRRCDPAVASACTELSAPSSGIATYPRVASWRDRSLLLLGERVYPVSATLERGPALQVGPVHALAPLGRMGVLIVHRSNSGAGLEISAWRGGSTVQHEAVDLGEIVGLRFAAVPERSGWLYVAVNRAGASSESFYLLDPRGRSTEIAEEQMTPAVPKQAAEELAGGPFRVGGEPTVSHRADGQQWSYWSAESQGRWTVVQSSQRSDGELWLSSEMQLEESRQTQDRMLYRGTATPDEGWMFRQRASDVFVAGWGEPLEPLPAVSDMPTVLELAFVRP